ncbi:serine threonine protein kinase [Trichoderma asperelloides]|nr:serine threonine protein kinase [Trichoderma asperelloides]
MSQPDKELLEAFTMSSPPMPVTPCITSVLNAPEPQRNIFNQQLMNSPRLSSPASSAMICAKDEAVSSSDGASTMPSTAIPPSDTMEQIQADLRMNDVLAQIQDITTLLKTLSLSVPEARLAIYSRQSNEKSIVKSSSIIHTEQTDGGIEILYIAQRTQDVDYTLEIQLKTPPLHSKITTIKCQIVYDPGTDNCVLINQTEGIVYLANLKLPYTYGLAAPNKPYLIKPGLWGIAVTRSDDIVDDCIVKFLLRERRHTISIAQPHGQRNKGLSTKRQKLSTNSATDVTTHSPSSGRGLKLNAKKGTGVTDNPLLDLQDGEVANIQTPLPKTTFLQGQSTYQLKCIRRISPKGVSRVFSCKHSLVLGNLAMKVIQYETEPLSQLVYCAELWKRERGFLEKLKHRNIVSLKAFDGRMLALHLELLPPTLAQGLDSPCRPSDVSKILNNISSALIYLEARGVVHNDIKPSNIAYSAGRGAVLFDFGVASLTKEPKLVGSPWYIPPELISSSRRYSAGDVWAFGIIMLYLIRKIQYPENIAKSWNIGEIREKATKARKQMKLWLDFINDAREDLDQTNAIEFVTFRMLDKNQHSRITAAEIQVTLQYLQ